MPLIARERQKVQVQVYIWESVRARLRDGDLHFSPVPPAHGVYRFECLVAPVRTSWRVEAAQALDELPPVTRVRSLANALMDALSDLLDAKVLEIEAEAIGLTP